MRSFLFSIISIIILVSVVSCDLHSSDNGPLDNFWYLRQIDTISTGNTKDYASNKVFWSFIDKMMQVESYGTKYLLRFEHNNDSLIFHSPYDNIKGDAYIQLTEDELPSLYKFGLHLSNVGDLFCETFLIDELNNNRMTLTSSNYRLHFIRY